MGLLLQLIIIIKRVQDPIDMEVYLNKATANLHQTVECMREFLLQLNDIIASKVHVSGLKVDLPKQLHDL